MPLSPEEGVFQLHLERRARLRLNSEEGACTAARDRQPAPPGSWLQALCTPQAQSKALVCSAACWGLKQQACPAARRRPGSKITVPACRILRRPLSG